MKTAFFLILLIFFNNGIFASSQQRYTMVSDLDDTIKMTGGTHLLINLYMALYSTKTYAGMSQLIYQMEEYLSDWHILTASPNILRPNIFKLINREQLSPDSVISRNLLRDRDKIDYKLSSVSKLFASSGSPMILLGDDVGKDPEAYQAFAAQKPLAVAAIYIRPIRERQLSEDIKYFYTAFDIAFHELNSGRMSLSSVFDVGYKILSSPLSGILPFFVACPKNWAQGWELAQPQLAQLIEHLREKILACNDPVYRNMNKEYWQQIEQLAMQMHPIES